MRPRPATWAASLVSAAPVRRRTRRRGVRSRNRVPEGMHVSGARCRRPIREHLFCESRPAV